MLNGRSIIKHSLLCLCFLPLAIRIAAAAGGSPAKIERSFETNNRAHVRIDNRRGQVTVIGWDRPQIHLIYTDPEAGAELEIEKFPASGPVERLHVTTRALDKVASARERTTDYMLKVPVGVLLRIRNEQGNVSISKLEGDAFVDTVGSTISVSEVAGHVSVRSATGDIDILSTAGRVEATSISGRLRFVTPMTYSVVGRTSSGNIVYDGDLMPTANYNLSTHNGSIDISLPSVVSFELRAKSWRGEVQSDFPLDIRSHRDSHACGGRTFTGAHKTGEATVVLRNCYPWRIDGNNHRAGRLSSAFSVRSSTSPGEVLLNWDTLCVPF